MSTQGVLEGLIYKRRGSGGGRERGERIQEVKLVKEFNNPQINCVHFCPGSTATVVMNTNISNAVSTPPGNSTNLDISVMHMQSPYAYMHIID